MVNNPINYALVRKNKDDNANSVGYPKGKPKKKHNPYYIACHSILAIITFGATCFLGYLLYTNFFSKNEDQNNGPKIPSVFIQEPFTKIKPSSKDKLLDSTFSIQLSTKITKPNNIIVETISFGTAWSFHLTNDSWYLLTNFHVVLDYLYDHKMDSWNSVIQNKKDFALHRTISNTDAQTNLQESFMKDDIQNSQISIISDNNRPDVNLFSDGDSNSSNHYSLDMAVIKIKNATLVNKIKPYMNDPVSEYLNNKGSIKYASTFYEVKGTKEEIVANNKDLIIGGFPARGNIGKSLYPTQYYMQVLPGGDPTIDKLPPTQFRNRETWNKIPPFSPTVPSELNKQQIDKIPKQWKLHQQGAVMFSELYYVQNPWEDKNGKPNPKLQWWLTGGASGSPVYTLPKDATGDFKDVEPIWAPIGIYWGGLVNPINDDEYFSPSFTMFISEIPKSTYNVYENFSDLLKSGKL